MGAGVQPVPGPTLHESSSTDRKAWLTNGSSAPSRSQARPLSPETPEAILAMTSDSRSAIGFPDESVGLNLGLRALLRGADRPAVNGHSAADARNPRLAERGCFDGDELGIRKPHGDTTPRRRQGGADPAPAPNVRLVRLRGAGHRGIKAHPPAPTAIPAEDGLQRRHPPPDIMIDLDLEQQRNAAGHHGQEALQR